MQKTPRTLFLPALLISLLLTACDDKQTTPIEEPLRPVRTIVASATNSITGRDFPGIVIAENRTDLSFRVAGKLKVLHVKEGDKVVKGQVIASLDKTDFKITVEDKQAGFNESKANFVRSAKLVEPGHISQREFEQIKATYSTASAHLKSARQNLLYSELKAPFNGSITKIHVDNFEEISAKDKIVTLQNLKSMQIEIDIPETLMIRLKRSQQPRDIYASFDAIKGEKFPLIFREVSAQADETTHAYKVKLGLPRIEKYTILPGMTATVFADEIRTDNNSTSDIIIPSHAVLEDNNGRFVFIAALVPGSTTTATVHRQNVTISRLTNNGLIISAGLNPDDLVITAGMSKMHEGLHVRLMQEQLH